MAQKRPTDPPYDIEEPNEPNDSTDESHKPETSTQSVPTSILKNPSN